MNYCITAVVAPGYPLIGHVIGPPVVTSRKLYQLDRTRGYLFSSPGYGYWRDMLYLSGTNATEFHWYQLIDIGSGFVSKVINAREDYLIFTKAGHWQIISITNYQVFFLTSLDLVLMQLSSIQMTFNVPDAEMQRVNQNSPPACIQVLTITKQTKWKHASNICLVTWDKTVVSVWTNMQ